MPLKVNIGLAKKLGQPNYSSAGASCNLEFELDSGQLLQDPSGFHRHLRHAFNACRQAIQDELNHQLNPPEVHEPEIAEGQDPQLEGKERDRSASESSSESVPPPTTTPATLGLVQTKPRASQRQLNYVHHLAHGISGLTPHRLEILSATVCGKRLAHLTSADASHLIETLKDIQSSNKDHSGAPQEVCA